MIRAPRTMLAIRLLYAFPFFGLCIVLCTKLRIEYLREIYGRAQIRSNVCFSRKRVVKNDVFIVAILKILAVNINIICLRLSVLHVRRYILICIDSDPSISIHKIQKMEFLWLDIFKCIKHCFFPE